MQMGAMPDDMIGAIKIKDGLFIGDEFAASVSVSQRFDVFTFVKYAEESDNSAFSV